MIGLTRLNGRAVIVNAELVETIESTPDTVVSLVTGKKFIVLESADDVVEKILIYRRQSAPPPPLPAFLGNRQMALEASEHED
jgi:flagellar protein FlbD